MVIAGDHVQRFLYLLREIIDKLNVKEKPKD